MDKPGGHPGVRAAATSHLDPLSHGGVFAPGYVGMTYSERVGGKRTPDSNKEYGERKVKKYRTY